MKYPDQFFYDLYGKNIKYTMSFFAFIVFGIFGYIVYEGLKYENFETADIKEIKVVRVFNHRGVLFLNEKYNIIGGYNRDTVSMDDILVPGAFLLKTENKDSIVIIDINGQVHSFILNDDGYW